MTTKRITVDYLRDMVDAAEKIGQFIEGMDYKRFMDDSKTAFAVIRALEMIGEAARKMSEPIKKEYSEIPWREITGIRDKLIHDYFGVNLEVV
jgi:uncharacterized protein with HEPN domain